MIVFEEEDKMETEDKKEERQDEEELLNEINADLARQVQEELAEDANQTEEESAIMLNMVGTVTRDEYVQRDMPEGTIITAPYYTDVNVLVTLK